MEKFKAGHFGSGRSWGNPDYPPPLDDEAKAIVAEAENYLKTLEGQLVDVD